MNAISTTTRTRFPALLAGVLASTLAGCAAGGLGSAGSVPEAAPEWRKYADERTGYEVWQITASDSASQTCYFETQCFTGDERYVVFTSRRSGSWQVYRSDLETGNVSRLTRAAELVPGSLTIHPNGRDAYFVDGWTLSRVGVESGEPEVVVDFRGQLPERPTGSPLSFTADGRYTVVASRTGEGTTLTRISLPDGTLETALRWERGLSHPMVNPTDPDLITFVPSPDTQNEMSLSREERARTWAVDARTGEARPFLTAPLGHRATHEIWAPSGGRFYFFQKSVPGWVPVSIASVDREGRDPRVHYTHDEIRLGHGDISEDERWFVSDGQAPDDNPLVLISLRTGQAEILSWPDASIRAGHSKQAHVHPSFSPRGNYVIYTSDRSGRPQVYVVPVPAAVKARLEQGATE